MRLPPIRYLGLVRPFFFSAADAALYDRCALIRVRGMSMRAGGFERKLQACRRAFAKSRKK
jgi:hypothetical protein